MNTLSRACSSQQLWQLALVRDEGRTSSWEGAWGHSEPPAGAVPQLQQHLSLAALAQQFCTSHSLSCTSKRLSRPSGALLPAILISRATVIFCQFCIHCCFQKFQFSVYTCFTMITLNNHWERQYYHVLISYKLLAKAAQKVVSARWSIYIIYSFSIFMESEALYTFCHLKSQALCHHS